MSTGQGQVEQPQTPEAPEIDTALPIDEIQQAFAEHIDPEAATPPTEEEVDDKYTINGQEYTEQELVDLAQLQQFIANNPGFQQHIQGYFQQSQLPTQPGTPQPPVPPVAPVAPSTQSAPVTLPEYIKPEWLADPIIKPLVDYTQSVESKLAEMQQTVAQFQQAQAQQRQSELMASANNAAAKFAQRMSLTPEEMNRVRNVASGMGLDMERMMSGIDPATGLPANHDFASAAERAYEIAYYAMPDMRARTVSEQVTQSQEKRVKRAKASSVSGSAGSASRTPPPPNKSQSLRDQLQAEVDRIYSEKGA